MAIFGKSITEIASDDLAELLTGRPTENIRLEFKREIPPTDELLKKLSSFANTFGGYLIVGAAAPSTSGQLEALPGVEPQPGIKQSIISRCYEGIWPPIDVLVSEAIPAPGSADRCCYVVFVPESLSAPHFLTHRRGAWIRTDEYSQRFEARLASFDEIQHLANRRDLAKQRRTQLVERAFARFEALIGAEYHNTPNTVGNVGATLGVSICPQFPVNRLIEEHPLLDQVRTTRVERSFDRFPEGEIVTQHESALVLHPHRGFSFFQADVWGHLFYSAEVEEVVKDSGKETRGISLAGIIGNILLWVEHARRFYRDLGYIGPLVVRVSLKRIGKQPFLYYRFGAAIPETKPSSRIDDAVAFDLPIQSSGLETDRDKTILDIVRVLFFALGWAEVAADSAYILDTGRRYAGCK